MSKAPAKPKQPRKASAVLNEKQENYVQARLDGYNKTDAAKMAGYSENNRIVEQSEDVKKALATARAQLSDATMIKRADVIEMFKEAYDMAKMGAEPASMVSAAKEIGKMLGFYEPETIKVQLSQSQEKIQSKLAVMSDEQLLEIIENGGNVVDGEFTRVQ